MSTQVLSAKQIEIGLPIGAPQVERPILNFILSWPISEFTKIKLYSVRKKHTKIGFVWGQIFLGDENCFVAKRWFGYLFWRFDCLINRIIRFCLGRHNIDIEEKNSSCFEHLNQSQNKSVSIACFFLRQWNMCQEMLIFFILMKMLWFWRSATTNGRKSNSNT